MLRDEDSAFSSAHVEAIGLALVVDCLGVPLLRVVFPARLVVDAWAELLCGWGWAGFLSIAVVLLEIGVMSSASEMMEKR